MYGEELLDSYSRIDVYSTCPMVLCGVSICTFMKVHSLTVVTFPLYTLTISHIFIYVICIEKDIHSGVNK